jgi:hypothetical protein
MRLVISDNGNIISTLTDTTDTHTSNASYLVNQEYIKCLNDAVIAVNIGCWGFYPQEQRIEANAAWVTQKNTRTKIFEQVMNFLPMWSMDLHVGHLLFTPTI